MCGIAAIFAYQSSAPNVERDEIIAIRDHMAARGPDGAGEWFSPNGRVGLGHRRLSIIDLSPTGAQPMFSADGSLAIIFNGEIYNYAELRSELLAKGYQFRSTSDTEVLLALYAEHGEAMLRDVRGMYAFAIWDGRREGLFLARDPFGIKPLYYADDGKTVRVASQVKALLAGGHVDTAPDPAGHVGYFLWGHVPDPYTLYRQVRALPAGSTLWIDQGGNKREKVFSDVSKILVASEETNSQLRTPSSEPAAARLRSALVDSVRYHLVADVPVGVFLSSGLDSTTLTALAGEQGGTLRTVTLGFGEFKGASTDETPLAEKFARERGAKHQTILVTRNDFQAQRENLFAAMDQPSTDGVNTYFVSLAAKRAGLKVAMSGLGGDEIFAGYPSFREIPPTVRALRIFGHVLGRPFRVLSSPTLKRFTSPKYAGLFEYGGTYAGAYFLRRGMFMPWELPDLLDAELVREGWEELQTLLRLEETVDGLTNPRLKISALEICWYMRNQLLRDSDWAGMAHSLEIRVPLVDRDFLRAIGPMLAGATPPTKRDMAQTPISQLPTSILDRSKTGFSVPVREWLLAENPKSEIRNPKSTERGLRGWAREVYSRFPEPCWREESRRSRHGGQAAVSSKLQAPNSRPQTPRSKPLAPERILVFRIGQLGDTIVSLPAMWAVRRNFPKAHLALLSDRHPGKSYVLASDLLCGAGIFDEFLSYPVSDTGFILRPGRMAALLTTIRRRKFNTLVYLAPSNRTPEQIERDRRFFSLAGVRRFIGMEGFPVLKPKEPGVPLEETPPESELLLNRISASGIPISPGDERETELGLSADEDERLAVWRSQLESDGGRPWLAVGPGSKMPAKRWPVERFEQVVNELIQEFDIWPVVFGGGEDRSMGEALLEEWGRGYNAAGALGLRVAAAGLKRCLLFLGNDTGTMHLAAAVGTPCVAVFSSREWPGMWFPYRVQQKVFRSLIECEGCGLVECIERQNECLKRISTTEVLEACRDILTNSKLGTRNAEFEMNVIGSNCPVA